MATVHWVCDRTRRTLPTAANTNVRGDFDRRAVAYPRTSSTTRFGNGTRIRSSAMWIGPSNSSAASAR